MTRDWRKGFLIKIWSQNIIDQITIIDNSLGGETLLSYFFKNNTPKI